MICAASGDLAQYNAAMYQISEEDLWPKAASEDVVYRTIVVGRLACNCTILGNKRTREVRGA